MSSVLLLGKPLRVHVTGSAQRALALRERTLLAEMELYFSCLIRKQVRFRNASSEADAVSVHSNLLIRFHPVMSASCAIDQTDGAPPLTDFPVARLQAFVPRWLRIDYRAQSWLGNFGFD